MQIAGQPCAGPETTVYAHIPLPDNSGMGMKPDDVCGAYACAICHDLLDGRRPGLSKDSADWYFYALRGMARTMRAMYESGIITIKGTK